MNSRGDSGGRKVDSKWGERDTVILVARRGVYSSSNISQTQNDDNSHT